MGVLRFIVARHSGKGDGGHCGQVQVGTVVIQITLVIRIGTFMNRLLIVSEWPRFADGGRYLCVIRERDGKRQHGFLIQGCWSVHLGYIWDGGTGQSIQYGSEDEILADGWQVD